MGVAPEVNSGAPHYPPPLAALAMGVAPEVNSGAPHYPPPLAALAIGVLLRSILTQGCTIERGIAGPREGPAKDARARRRCEALWRDRAKWPSSMSPRRTRRMLVDRA